MDFLQNMDWEPPSLGPREASTMCHFPQVGSGLPGAPGYRDTPQGPQATHPEPHLDLQKLYLKGIVSSSHLEETEQEKSHVG